jgi:hypothetical protein
MDNPYSITELRGEINDFAVPDYEHEGVRTYNALLRGVVPEFFNEWIWNPKHGLNIPMFQIDGKTWMSLTPMEIQSAFVPIMCANGVVGTSGLGLGYFALRAAAKPEVDRVYAYEIDPRVIRYFNECYHDREGFDKIHIIEGDVRNCKGNEYDFFFMDTYLTMLPDETLTDAREFTQRNSVKRYHFWGQEKCYLHLFMDQYATDDDKTEQLMSWPQEIRHLVAMWFHQQRTVDKRRVTIYGLYDEFPMDDYARDAVELLTEVSPVAA